MKSPSPGTTLRPAGCQRAAAFVPHSPYLRRYPAVGPPEVVHREIPTVLHRGRCRCDRQSSAPESSQAPRSDNERARESSDDTDTETTSIDADVPAEQTALALSALGDAQQQVSALQTNAAYSTTPTMLSHSVLDSCVFKWVMFRSKLCACDASWRSSAFVCCLVCTPKEPRRHNMLASDPHRIWHAGVISALEAIQANMTTTGTLTFSTPGPAPRCPRPI